MGVKKTYTLTTSQLHDFYINEYNKTKIESLYLKAALVQNAEKIMEPTLSSGLQIIEGDILISYQGNESWVVVKKGSG